MSRNRGEAAHRGAVVVSVLVWSAAAAVLLGAAPIAGAQVTYRTVAFQTGFAPGTGNIFGTNLQKFNTFGTPAIDAAGGIGFHATLAGPSVTSNNDTGVWSQGGGGPLELVAREGNAAIPPGGLAGFGPIPTGLTINQAGQVGFTASISGSGVPASADRGIWSGDSNGLSLVAREGDRPPGLPAGVGFTSFISPTLNHAGQAAFLASAGGADGIWSQGGGALGLVALENGPVPGLAPGVVFQQLNAPVAINGAGQTAFFGAMAGPGVTNNNNVGVWAQRNGSLGLVAREGNQAPGAGSVVTFSNLGTPMINDAGEVALIGTLTGLGVTADNDAGIWSEGGSTLRLVAREGSPAPDTAAGVVFADLVNAPLINANGQTLVRGLVSGPGITADNDEGLWLDTQGTLEVVVQEGTPAPGLGVGVRFGSILSSVLNGRGQVAFTTTLEGVGVNANNNTALWATGLDGSMNLIVRKGNLFSIGGQGASTVTTISITSGTGGQDGKSTSFNDAGQLAFHLRFPGVGGPDQGVFVATLPSVLLGDYNNSGLVEQGDLDLVLQNWGDAFNTLPGTWVNQRPTAGIVDQAELDGVLTHWGDTGAPRFSDTDVPEPAALAAVAGLTACRPRRELLRSRRVT